MGENITTRGIDLLALPHGTKLTLGKAAVVEITGFRIPCSQLDGLQPGLMQAVLGRDDDGNPTSKAGIMSIVLSGGEVKPGDSISVECLRDLITDWKAFNVRRGGENYPVGLFSTWPGLHRYLLSR